MFIVNLWHSVGSGFKTFFCLKVVEWQLALYANMLLGNEYLVFFHCGY